MTILLTVLIGVFCSVAAAELLDICPWLTDVLLSQAALRLPVAERERWVMEWRGDRDYMKTRRGNFAILVWAIGVLATSRRLANELPAPTLEPPQFTFEQLSLFSGPPSIPGDSFLNVSELDIPTIIRDDAGHGEIRRHRARVHGRVRLADLLGTVVRRTGSHVILRTPEGKLHAMLVTTYEELRRYDAKR